MENLNLKNNIKKITKIILKYLLPIISAIFNLVLIAIAIFLVLCIFLLITSPSFAVDEKTPVKKFHEAMQYADSLKNTVVIEKDSNTIKVGSYKLDPEKTFSDPKTQKSWYTNNPAQTSYYNTATQDNADKMKKDAMVETTKDEDHKDANGNSVPTFGKTIVRNFQTRPIYKITKDDEFIAKSNWLIKNAKNIASGTFGNDVKKKTICEATYEQKTCNEEVRTIKKICEEKAKVTISTRDVSYPNCKKLIIVQNANSYCPSGYAEMLYTDMVASYGNNWDDIRFCTKMAAYGETSECFLGGYYVSVNAGQSLDQGRATVPKKAHARIRFSNIYWDNLYASIINESTGNALYRYNRFYNGQVIDLPYSEIQDQTFRFYSHDKSPGVMVLYIDRILYRKKFASVNWVLEKPCDEI